MTDAPASPPLRPIPGPADRESFLAAQARHRAAGRRRGVVVSALAVLLALIVAIPTAPLAYVAVGLVADLVNLVVPAPDLLGGGLALVAPFVTAADVAWRPLLTTLLIWSLPGFAGLVLLWIGLARVTRATTPMAIEATLGLRSPRTDDPEERQLANVVEEIAIAAQLPAPAVKVADRAAVNLGAYAGTEGPVVFVTRGLLDRLDRASTQALVAHLIAGIGNGDLALGDRLRRVQELTGLLMTVAQAPVSRAARAVLAELWRALRGDPKAQANAAVDLFGGAIARNLSEKTQVRARWRDLAPLPLLGPMAIGLVMVPLGQLLLLAAPLGLAWRSRRLLADATAVQLSRDPSALAAALSAASSAGTAMPEAGNLVANLFALSPWPSATVQVLSPWPKIEARVAALVRQGANPDLAPAPGMHGCLVAILALLLVPLLAPVALLLALGTLIGGLAAIAITTLFLGPPVALVHWLLRMIGHG